MILPKTFLPFFQSLTGQFHRWSLSWFWHSAMERRIAEVMAFIKPGFSLAIRRCFFRSFGRRMLPPITFFVVRTALAWRSSVFRKWCSEGWACFWCDCGWWRWAGCWLLMPDSSARGSLQKIKMMWKKRIIFKIRYAQIKLLLRLLLLFCGKKLVLLSPN